MLRLLPALVLLPAALPAQEDVMRMRAESLGPRFHVISGFANGNILVAAGDDAVALVDGQSTKRVALADSVLRTLTALPVRVVVNTHYHGDHTEGNAHWRAAGAEVWAHPNVAVQARKDTVIPEWHEWHRTPLAEAAMPTRPAADGQMLTMGPEQAQLIHVPRAHTDGDLMVWFPRANVLHAGDIVELGAYPFLDWWAGGTFDGMLAAVDRVLAVANDSTRIVPGHGPVADVAAVRRYRAMMVAVAGQVRAGLRAGKTADQVVAERPTAEFDAWQGRGGENFVRLLHVGMRKR